MHTTTTDRPQQLAERLASRTSAAITRSIHFIDAHPIASVGIALGLGYYSRTLLRLGMVAGAGTLVARVLPRLGRRSAGSQRPADVERTQRGAATRE
jgi:hypothetical protein